MYVDGYTADLVCTYSENRLIEVLIAIAYPFLLLRLDNYVLLVSVFSVTLYNINCTIWRRLCEFMYVYTLILVGPTPKSD